MLVSVRGRTLAFTKQNLDVNQKHCDDHHTRKVHTWDLRYAADDGRAHDLRQPYRQFFPRFNASFVLS